MSSQASKQNVPAKSGPIAEQTTELQESTEEMSATNPSGDKLKQGKDTKTKDIKKDIKDGVESVKDQLPSKKDIKDTIDSKTKDIKESLPSKKDIKDGIDSAKESLPSTDDIKSKAKELKSAADSKAKEIKDSLPSKKDIKDGVESVKKSLPSTKEIKDKASQLQEDATQKLQETSEQIQKGLIPSMKRQMASFRRSVGPWFQNQGLSSKAMVEDIMRQPPAAKMLLGALVLTNFILPMFILNRREGLITMLTYVLVSTFATLLYGMTPKQSPHRLLMSNFSHVLFVPLMFYLAYRLNSHDVHTSEVEMEHVDVIVKLLLKRGWFFLTLLPTILTVDAVVLINDAMQLYGVISHLTQGKSPKSLEDAMKIGHDAIAVAATGDESQTIAASQAQAAPSA